MAVARSSDIVEDDERGFTVAGRDYQFDTEAADRSVGTAPRRRKWTLLGVKRRRSRALRTLSMPVAPAELDLEGTLKADKSFAVSPDTSEEESSSGLSTNRSRSGSGEKERRRRVTHGQARTRDDSETESVGNPQQQNHRRPSVITSMMERLRSASISHNASSVDESMSDLHSVTSVKMLRRELHKQGADPNDSFLLHTILKKKFKRERKRRKLLLAALTYSNVNVNLRDETGMTALHCAVEDYDLECIKILIAFGANVNAIDQRSRTPIDLICADLTDMETNILPQVPPNFTPTLPLRQLHQRQPSLFENTARSATREEVVEVLRASGGVREELVQRVAQVPSVPPFPQVPLGGTPSDAKQRSQVIHWTSQLIAQYNDLQQNIHERFRNTSRAGESETFSSEEAVPIAMQLNEIEKFKRAGSRILCLDGGGIRGLIQLEVLSQLEKKTGRKITELFDWIIGTSTGGLIALGLVYAKKSITQLRQLYFKMKDEIFGKVRHGGISFNTLGLEKLLKEEFPEHICMDDESYPRVLISAVRKEHINLKLCFFNNCFEDEFCKHKPVWKVARYTSAAPVLFGECDGFVDGGVLANNPSESGLTRIYNHYRSKGQKLPISLVVSVGCGKYPIKELGSVDVFSGAEAWLDVRSVKDRTTNFMSLLTYALVEPSISDSNCKSRCEEQNISYFRLNPRLEQVIGAGETDRDILISMIIQTNKEMNERREMADLVLCFHTLSEAARKMHAHINGEESDTDTSTIQGSKSGSSMGSQ